jgi:hypothetical protein
MSEVGFCPTGKAWNEGNWFCPDWNSLDWRKLVSAKLEWHGIEKVNFGLTGKAWNGGSIFLKSQKVVKKLSKNCQQVVKKWSQKDKRRK